MTLMDELIHSFYGRLSAALSSEDGHGLAQLLRLNGEDTLEHVELHALMDKTRLQSGINAAQRRFSVSVEFHEIALFHLLAYRELCAVKTRGEKGYGLAMKFQVKKFDKFLEMYKSGGSWLVECMQTMILDTRTLAKHTDLELSTTGTNENASMIESKRLLDTCFRYTIMGRAANPDGLAKRQSALSIVTNQFKIYFKLGTLQLCKNLIRSVGQPNFPAFDGFPIAHRVTYKFYVGRIKVLEDDMKAAHENLSYALKHCNKNKPRNVLLILEYLIPVKLILGYLPQTRLLSVQGLQHLQGLIKAVKDGNVKLLTAELEKNQTYFIERGLYLILDRLKLIAYRNLFKKVVLVHQEIVSADPEQKKSAAQRVPLTLLEDPFKKYGETIEETFGELVEGQDLGEESVMEQLKCILANLVFKGHVKGYIAHEKNFLVLSANNPFPRIAKS